MTVNIYPIFSLLQLWWIYLAAGSTSIIHSVTESGIIVHDNILIQPLSGSDQLAKLRQNRPKNVPIYINKTAGESTHHILCNGNKHPDDPYKTTTKGRRHRRQAVGKFIVETVVFLDYPLFLFWRGRNRNNIMATKQEMVDYYANLIAAVNRRFESASTARFSVSIVVNAFIIAETPSSSNWTQSLNVSNRADASLALDNLNAYLLSRRGVIPVSKDKTVPYDHAFILSGFDLSLGDRTSIVGIAQHRTCDHRSGSITEDLRSESTAVIIAHEIGHALTSRHDGDRNRCNSGLNYVMASSLRLPPRSRTSHPWRFSSCSATYFRNYFASPSAACTRRVTGRPMDLTPFLRQPFGQKYPPDVQCEIFLGTGSKLCRQLYNGDKRTFDDMCRTMFCDDPGSNFCYAIPAHDGTSCGDKKWCQKGSCVASSQAPATFENCPAGDDPDVQCSQASCNQPILRDFVCCDTCKRPAARQLPPTTQPNTTPPLQTTPPPNTTPPPKTRSRAVPPTASYFDTGKRVPPTASMYPHN